MTTTPEPLDVYGLTQCDTVKKARRWLDARDVPYRFHDFRKQGLDPARLDDWLAALGADVVLNRKGTTWRKLNGAQQARASDPAGLRALLLEHPSLVKRPVVAWPDGVTVGFAEAEFERRVRTLG